MPKKDEKPLPELPQPNLGIPQHLTKSEERAWIKNVLGHGMPNPKDLSLNAGTSTPSAAQSLIRAPLAKFEEAYPGKPKYLQ